ncbi:hypothetical protein ACOBV8_20050 (plasmid) [Pseudoalteromonas espejiana]
MDNFFSTVETRFLSEVDLYTNVELASNSNPSNQMSYGKYFITDMTVGYNFDSGLGVKIGVDNLFNRKLPYGSRGTSAESASYDNIGRFGYINLSYSL